MFQLDSVALDAGDHRILSGLTLELPVGQIIGLVGPNGSGKSTLIRALARQTSPAAGTISLSGKALADYGHRELARILAYLPQFSPPAEGMKVAELVALGRYPWHGALGRFTTADRRAVEEAMRETGIEAFADRAVDDLSGGERQRVWLAMALAQEPKALLLDEPTSALDLRNAVAILDLVRDLSHRTGLTALIVLHDINLAARFCDRIIALRDGGVVCNGTPAAIIDPAMLEAVYGVPMRTVSVPASPIPVAYVAYGSD